MYQDIFAIIKFIGVILNRLCISEASQCCLAVSSQMERQWFWLTVMPEVIGKVVIDIVGWHCTLTRYASHYPMMQKLLDWTSLSDWCKCLLVSSRIAKTAGDRNMKLLTLVLDVFKNLVSVFFSNGDILGFRKKSFNSLKSHVISLPTNLEYCSWFLSSGIGKGQNYIWMLY